ncbi:MAG: Lrp/AsnC family transcriptional regulator [Candidatus Woesearchaeota archaeon]
MHNRTYKRSDIILLSKLRNDARTTLTKLSKNTRIPISTVFDKIRSFENDFVTKYTSLIDFTKFGFYARANVILKIGKKHLDNVRDYLAKHPNVNTLYKINNGFDYQVELVFRDMQGLETFLWNLNTKFTIKQYIVYYIIDEIKKESFLTSKETIEMIAPEIKGQALM